MTIKEDEIKIIDETEVHLFSKVNSCGLNGINAYPVEIEIDLSGGLPNFILVGLPDTAINESRERVRAAIKASNLEFLSKKIVVNLAPADTKKAGPTYDLPIAIGILSATENINKNNLDDLYIVGELGLFGKVRPVNGVLSYAILVKNKKARGIIIPKQNENEALLIEGINIYPISDLTEAINVINNINNIKPAQKTNHSEKDNFSFDIDFSEVKGQTLTKRALEISASGGHHVLMIGSPGSGKTMLAQRLPTIFPPLTYEEKVEVTQLYSIAGKLSPQQKIINLRPFRSPHHSASVAGLIGGGSIPQPGEISLAHKGVLFLDELTEFQNKVLDSLRQAIELKYITIARSRKSILFPCDFILITACNPCPCGYFGDTLKNCICNKNIIKKYQSKISGPILDRIDLQTEVKRLSESELLSIKDSESSKTIKKRVLKAWEIQQKRYKSLNITLNSHISTRNIRQFCNVNSKAEIILKEAIKTFALTARSYDRILKVSRTIADLDNSDIIKDEHILEALQFRLNTFRGER